MLVVDSFSEDSFASRIERQQIDIVICPPVKYAAPAINGGVDQGVSRAAVFSLDVVDRLARFHIGVMPEEHIFATSPLAAAAMVPAARAANFPRAI